MLNLIATSVVREICSRVCHILSRCKVPKVVDVVVVDTVGWEATMVLVRMC